jgi:hypothetical protein
MPQLPEGASSILYDAACCAVLQAADPGEVPSEDERAHLRTLARSWLGDSLEVGETGHPDGWKPLAENALEDPDFATVRGAALDGLPEQEREAWSQLWQGLEEALERAHR